MKFAETLFNERQAGKDQCNRDGAAAKRQMNFFVERGNNIETAQQMNQALCLATALCGFTSCVLEIVKFPKTSYISHNLKYIYNEKDVSCHVWMYQGTGEGKEFNLPYKPKAPTFTEAIGLVSSNSFGTANNRKETVEQLIPCADNLCIETFHDINVLQRHLDFSVRPCDFTIRPT